LSDLPPQIPTRRKILYALILVCVALLLGEGLLRLRAWIKYGDAATGFRDPMVVYDPALDLTVPRPNYEVRGKDIHIKINSLGFRGPEITREKPPHTVRIACLGASTTFSAEASSNDEVWTKILQDKLQAAHPDVHFEVINAGVPGYTSAENLKYLRSHVLEIDPDMVLYYEANNEIVKDTRALAIAKGIISPNSGRRSPLVHTLSRVSFAFDLIYKNLAILLRSHEKPQSTLDEVPPQLPAHFLSNLDQMRQVLASRNIRFVLSTFIVKYRHDQDRTTRIKNADVAFYYMPWMSIDGMLNAIDVYNQAILDYGKSQGLLVVDDRDAIPADDANFADCMHLADKGNEAMAQRFFGAFQAAGLDEQLAAAAAR
jgi:lysophospholipase L1-like esterase